MRRVVRVDSDSISGSVANNRIVTHQCKKIDILIVSGAECEVGDASKGGLWMARGFSFTVNDDG